MTVVKFKRRPSIAQLVCSSCGAQADAACNCGANYVPAGQLAAQAVTANPELSDRALADATGVGKDTVRRARKKATGASAPVDAPRTGRDGKQRKPPQRQPAPVSDPAQEAAAFISELGDFLTGFEERFTAWHETKPNISKQLRDDIMSTLDLCGRRFYKIAQSFDGRE